jgi:hypothetical protein
MASYYDYVLALIPVAMLTVTGLLTALGWSLVAAAPVGATAATLVIGHAMFVNAPTDPAPETPAPDVAPPTAD